MKHLIVGNGQIGQAVHKLLSSGYENIETYDTQTDKESDKERIKTAGPIDILHVSFPYSDRFVDFVKQYIEEFEPRATVVYSTVAIGTCKQIGQNVFHSPVVGRHPDLDGGIKHGVRFIGTNQKDAHPVDELWQSLGVKVRVVDSTDATEFIKIRSTSKFGINLVWTEYEKMIADDIGMDFALLKEFDQDYNRIYKELGMEWAQQYILDPPQGKIGGHCVIPNAELLNQQYPSDLLEKIISMKPHPETRPKNTESAKPRLTLGHSSAES